MQLLGVALKTDTRVNFCAHKQNNFCVPCWKGIAPGRQWVEWSSVGFGVCLIWSALIAGFTVLWRKSLLAKREEARPWSFQASDSSSTRQEPACRPGTWLGGSLLHVFSFALFLLTFNILSFPSLLKKFFYRCTVDLQCCVSLRHMAKWLVIHIQINIFFFIFFSITIYYRVLNIVPYAFLFKIQFLRLGIRCMVFWKLFKLCTLERLEQIHVLELRMF